MKRLSNSEPDTEDSDEYKENSHAVQAHLSIAQSVIQRMATNSASCKAWCIALVSAIMVVVADKGKGQYTFIGIIPTILFLVLDAYYLSLERRFREAYNLFIKKLHKGNLVAADLYAISPSGEAFRKFFSSVWSFSIWPFYLTLLVTLFVVKTLVVTPVPNTAVHQAEPAISVIQQGHSDSLRHEPLKTSGKNP